MSDAGEMLARCTPHSANWESSGKAFDTLKPSDISAACAYVKNSLGAQLVMTKYLYFDNPATVKELEYAVYHYAMTIFRGKRSSPNYVGIMVRESLAHFLSQALCPQCAGQCKNLETGLTQFYNGTWMTCPECEGRGIKYPPIGSYSRVSGLPAPTGRAWQKQCKHLIYLLFALEAEAKTQIVEALK